MSRVIKFRVWDNSYKKFMVKKDDHGYYYKNFSCPSGQPTDIACLLMYSDTFENTVHQFTGLLDKNNVEIYEGDIVVSSRKMSRGASAGTPFLVVYNSFLCNYALDPRGMDYARVTEFSLPSNRYDLTGAKATGLTVVGNIFENPDLLK